MNYAIIENTPIGTITICERDEKLASIIFGKVINRSYTNRKTPLLATVEKQLQQYFSRERTSFSLPLLYSGTTFQANVWNALQTIPYGETRSYKEIALAIGNSKAVRAVGMANNRNPLPIVIPCHRVIGADRALVGYGGGLDIKKHLLNLEFATIRYQTSP